MKIAQVCPRYFPYIGGIETHVEEISSRLLRMGNSVEILSTDPTGKLPHEEFIKGIKVRRFRSWAPNEAYYFSPGLYAFLRVFSSEFDIVHAHSFHAFPSLFAAWAKQTNLLVFTPHYHGMGHTFIRNALHKPYNIVAKRIFDSASLVIYVSEYEKKLLTKQFQIDQNNLKLIPNGINWSEFKGLEKILSGHITILYVGRLERYKRIDVLIRALNYLESGTKLEIVGSGPDKERLLNLSFQSGFSKEINFSERLDRKGLLEKYSIATTFVILSKSEAYGISVAEALAARTPCIVANNSGLSEWIDNKNCFGVNKPDDPKEVADAIRKSVNVVVKDVKILDWDEIAETTADAYRFALAKQMRY